MQPANLIFDDIYVYKFNFMEPLAGCIKIEYFHWWYIMIYGDIYIYIHNHMLWDLDCDAYYWFWLIYAISVQICSTNAGLSMTDILYFQRMNDMLTYTQILGWILINEYVLGTINAVGDICDFILTYVSANWAQKNQ